MAATGFGGVAGALAGGGTLTASVALLGAAAGSAALVARPAGALGAHAAATLGLLLSPALGRGLAGLVVTAAGRLAVAGRRLLAAAGTAAAALCGCTSGRKNEETGPDLILRYAENQPEDYPTTQAALAFAGLLNEQTDGRVQVAVYSGGELGAEQSVIEQMRFGGIDFARVSLSQLAEYVPELSVLQLPYLY